MLLLRGSEGCLDLPIRESPLGRSFKDKGSLPSRFIPDTDVDVADLNSAIVLLGPLETLRRCSCSVDRARCSVLLELSGAGRFVAAPGFCSFLLEDRFRALDLTGDTITGPPSLRLIASHRSGNRAEKLGNA